MKTLKLTILLLFAVQLWANEIPEKAIKTKIKEVTVFLEGAQITRKKSIDLISGKTLIKFTNLSPFIDAKSVQVKATGAVTVLSVNHEKNYLEQNEKSTKLKELEAKRIELEDKIEIENTYLSIIHKQLNFIEANTEIVGPNQSFSIDDLKEVSGFYESKLTSLKIKELERNKTVEVLNEKLIATKHQINTIQGKKVEVTSEILVKVDAKKSTKATFELTYLVANAGWFPSYDIRAKSIADPIRLTYKANVHQDTKVDWKNATLTFSSAEPNVSGVAPKLLPYFINFYSYPPVYKRGVNSVSGVVLSSEDGMPIPGATVTVKGTTIGTITDMNGYYTLTVPNHAGSLIYSFVGMRTQELPITGPVLNTSLQTETLELDEIVVTNDKVKRFMPGIKKESIGFADTGFKNKNNFSIPLNQQVNQTSIEFAIKIPYTVNSDNKNYTIEMESYELPADYQYYSVPKINKNAYLMANISEWEDFNILDGEANIFFEGTYVGKTLLETQNANDTLNISLGRDKNVIVTREKIRDFTSRQFLSAKKVESRAWEIKVRNNKKQAIEMLLLDQVPVSTMEEIEVEILTKSGARFNNEDGEVKWEFKLEPSTEKEFELKYQVKYPKNQNLVVD